MVEVVSSTHSRNDDACTLSQTIRFSAEAGAYGVPEVESALRKQPEDRLHRDVQVITDWLGQQVQPITIREGQGCRAKECS